MEASDDMRETIRKHDGTKEPDVLDSLDESIAIDRGGTRAHVAAILDTPDI